MIIDSRRWMNYAIEISKRSSSGGLLVGAALVPKENELICSAFSGEKMLTPGTPFCCRRYINMT